MPSFHLLWITRQLDSTGLQVTGKIMKLICYHQLCCLNYSCIRTLKPSAYVNCYYKISRSKSMHNKIILRIKIPNNQCDRKMVASIRKVDHPKINLQLRISMEEPTEGNSELNLSVSELLINNPPRDIFSICHQWNSSWSWLTILTSRFVFLCSLWCYCHCTWHHTRH